MVSKEPGRPGQDIENTLQGVSLPGHTKGNVTYVGTYRILVVILLSCGSVGMTWAASASQSRKETGCLQGQRTID